MFIHSGDEDDNTFQVAGTLEAMDIGAEQGLGHRALSGPCLYCLSMTPVPSTDATGTSALSVCGGAGALGMEQRRVEIEAGGGAMNPGDPAVACGPGLGSEGGEERDLLCGLLPGQGGDQSKHQPLLLRLHLSVTPSPSTDIWAPL